MRRWLSRGAILLAVLVVAGIAAAAVPITGIEVSCTRGMAAPDTYQPMVQDPGYKRAEADSYMTYPEWYVVHAYSDLAAVTRQSSESRFDYMASMRTFWTSLCQATATARAIGPVTLDQRMTDYVVGLSFSLEMTIQGLWERTIGAATAWLRGPDKTPEDRFNQHFLDDYAVFLRQTPWYDYPFGATFVRFWRETPWSWASPVRSLERRVALSLQYGVKALYAVPIAALAGASPADKTIETVVTHWTPGGDSGVTKVRDVGVGTTLVRTKRYEAYTNILRDWAGDGTTIVEIAGNDRILTTAIVPDGTKLDLPGARAIFAIPIQSQPGRHRVGLDTSVPHLTQVITGVGQQGAWFEHAYDY